MLKTIECYCKNKSTRKYAIATVGFIVITLFFFYAFIYNDILETSRCGVNFWHDLVEGKLRYFYARRTDMPAIAYQRVVRASYEFPIYIVFAIWNFPLFLLEKFAHVDIFGSVLCLMWAKTILLFFVVLLCIEIVKICKKLAMKKETIAIVVMLFLTANFLTTSVVMMSSYEVISLYFSLIAINKYMEGDGTGFLIYFTIAVSMKYFALFIFIPLLLLKEKNIFKIAGNVLITILPVLACRLLIPMGISYPDISDAAERITAYATSILTASASGTAAIAEAVVANASHGMGIGNLGFLYALQYYLEIGTGRMYYSVFAFVTLYVICYVVKIEKQEELNKWVIYVCVLAYGLLFTTFFTHAYWIVLLVPFLVILIGQNSKYLYINMLLEMALTWGMIMAQMVRFSWLYGSAIAECMYIPKIVGELKKEEYQQFTIGNLIQNLGMDFDNISNGITGLGMGIFISCLVLFFVLNFPKAEWKFKVTCEGETIKWWLVGIRVLAGWCIALVPIGLLLLQRMQ